MRELGRRWAPEEVMARWLAQQTFKALKGPHARKVHRGSGDEAETAAAAQPNPSNRAKPQAA